MELGCLQHHNGLREKIAAALFLILACTVSCITIPKSQTRDLPLEIQKKMTSCLGEGSGYATLLKEKNLLGRYETDWSFLDSRILGIQILGVFGETIHEISYDGVKFSQKGKLDKILGPLKVKSDGFLNFSGHDLPIQIYEMACLFHGTFPTRWLEHLQSIQIDKVFTKAYFESENRLIVIEMLAHANKSQELCARYYWGGFLGLWQNELKWCLPNQFRKSVHLTYEDFELRWLLQK
ncbi:MAG: hypothetical protein KBD78_05695 [Oligoflexales bacterium]|nr:hypothetical protein [Oligoflexales bacterium]